MRAKAGDSAAYGDLYDRYVERIYRFVYYKVLHKETAEDIVSDAFYKALDRIGSYDETKGPFSAWLYSIARNAVIDHYRARRANANIEDYFDLGEDARIEEEIDARDAMAKVAGYLASLTPKQREIVTLRVWQDLPYKDIAEIVGGSEASAKMAFSRAIASLREKFGPLAALAVLLIRP